MTVRSMHVITDMKDLRMLTLWWNEAETGGQPLPPCRYYLGTDGQRVLDFAVRCKAAYDPAAVAHLRGLVEGLAYDPVELRTAQADDPSVLSPGDPYAIAFAAAAFQAASDLVVDGVPGPRTAAALVGKTFAPAGAEYIVADGQRVPCPFPVTTWDEPGGMDLRAYHGPHRLRQAVRMLMLHWDGCLTSRQCYHVLLERELSVQFLLDADGMLYQCADLLAWCYHGGPSVNQWSVGVEICNPVMLDRQVHDPYGNERPVVEELEAHTNGRVRRLGFTAAQHATVARLAGWLNDQLGIPLQAPRAGFGGTMATLNPADVDTGVVQAVVDGSFRGIVGHFHASDNKIDPGFSLWPTVIGVP